MSQFNEEDFNDLREYIRSPSSRHVKQPEESKKSKSPSFRSKFRSKYQIDPRNFLRMASDSPVWNEEGEEVIDKALTGRASEEEIDALGDAFFNEAPKLNKERNEKKVPKLTGTDVSNWWKNLKLPKAK